MKNTKTYQYEVRLGNELVTYTDVKSTALQHGFDAAEASGYMVTIIDNDAAYPVAYRIARGMIEVLQH